MIEIYKQYAIHDTSIISVSPALSHSKCVLSFGAAEAVWQLQSKLYKLCNNIV